LICGVPYGAISLATVNSASFYLLPHLLKRSLFYQLNKAVCLNTDKSLIFKRKEHKSHGTKNMIEGIFKPNERCLIVDDVITSGISIMETVQVTN